MIQRGLLAVAAMAALSAPMARSQEGVPAARLTALDRGVNLGNWFSQAPDGPNYRHEWLRSWIGAADFQALARAGFRHVRFPVEFEMFLDEDNPSRLRPEFLPDFDLALDRILGAGLAVDVDFHAREDTKARLLTDDAFARQLARLWGAVARHLADRDPNRVFLETMNEPTADMPLARWLEIQRRFFAAMRAAAPDRTLIVTANRWDAISQLVRLQPLADRDVVYTFHFYEPLIFTHQGASWVRGQSAVAGLAYPSDPANAAAVARTIGDPAVRAKILKTRADRDWLAAQISQAASWARAHRVPLYCGEFGTYTMTAPRESRLRWIRDVRELCEARGIGWAMWDYCGGFRAALGQPGQRRLDPDCLRALGLGRERTAVPAPSPRP